MLLIFTKILANIGCSTKLFRRIKIFPIIIIDADNNSRNRLKTTLVVQGFTRTYAAVTIEAVLKQEASTKYEVAIIVEDGNKLTQNMPVSHIFALLQNCYPDIDCIYVNDGRSIEFPKVISITKKDSFNAIGEAVKALVAKKLALDSTEA